MGRKRKINNDDESDKDDLTSLTPIIKKKRIQEMLENGEIKKASVNDPTFQFYMKGDKIFEYMDCKLCHAFIKDCYGGHKQRHINGTCCKNKVGNINEKTSGVNEKVLEAVAVYILKSGLSFNHAESEEIREFVSSLVDRPVTFPTRHLVKKRILEKFETISKDLGDEISAYVKSESASLIVDFGKHVHDYLSVFIAYIKVDEKMEAVLNIRPFAFSPTKERKTADHVFDLIATAAEKLGLTREEIKKLPLVSDGGANMVLAGQTYFKSWTLCGCHSMQKMSERVIVPTKDLLIYFNHEELQELEKCDEILSKTAKLSSIIHADKSETIKPKPAKYIETRWQTKVKCARDVISVLPLALQSESVKICKLAEEILEERDHLIDIVAILEKFEPLLFLFEKTEITIHHFLPKLTTLNKFFREEEVKQNNYITTVLSKSAKLVTKKYLETKISDVHLKTTFLTPGYKRMSKLSSDFKTKAIKLIEEELASIKVDPVPVVTYDNNEENDYDEIDDSDDDEEIKRYLLDKGPVQEEPMKYWIRKKK